MHPLVTVLCLVNEPQCLGWKEGGGGRDGGGACTSGRPGKESLCMAAHPVVLCALCHLPFPAKAATEFQEMHQGLHVEIFFANC